MVKREAPEEEAQVFLKVTKKEAEERIKIQINKGQEIKKTDINTKEELRCASQAKQRWESFNRDLLRRLFSNSSIENEYSEVSFGVSQISASLGYYIQEFREEMDESISRLLSVKERLVLIPESDLSVTGSEMIPLGREVFVVHGTDETIKTKVARYLEKLDLVPIILHEQANKGRTIIQKFEDYSSVVFAVVIMTGDDEGYQKGFEGEARKRARQNVILELGYFLGKLGGQRVCVLYEDGVEVPSDYRGVLYVPIDNEELWRFSLAKEIKAANIQVDINQLV